MLSWGMICHICSICCYCKTELKTICISIATLKYAQWKMALQGKANMTVFQDEMAKDGYKNPCNLDSAPEKVTTAAKIHILSPTKWLFSCSPWLVWMIAQVNWLSPDSVYTETCEYTACEGAARELSTVKNKPCSMMSEHEQTRLSVPCLNTNN